ncbi:MAG: M67 family metallopeptidase [Actinobacteria bacterium]|nr:M67 family metallopeptidase [Actinomycetota bacterium]
MTTPVVLLPESLRTRILEHCLASLPEEGCGLLAMEGGTVVGVYPTTNQDHSPNRYTIPPAEHYAALVEAESRGWELGGVFHSHPHGPASLSTVDLENAIEPDWIYVVVGLGGDPEVRGWRVVDGRAETLVIEPEPLTL